MYSRKKIGSIFLELDANALASAKMTGIVVPDDSDSNGDFFFEAKDHDPQIFIPKIPLEAVGAGFCLKITLPCEVLVQLFYQTIDSPEFSESNSVSVSLPRGSHCIEWFVDKPLNGFFRLDPGNLPGPYIIHCIEVVQNYAVHSLMPASVSRGSLEFNQMRDLRLSDEGLHMKATGRDPYFLLPEIDLELGSTTIKLDLTLQREAMVQLYYQTKEKKEFTEEQSIVASKPPGRHVLERVIHQNLNGVFRLDPGNMPWEYTVHRIEALQGLFIQNIDGKKLFESDGVANQIEDIVIDEDGVAFLATGDDPYIILPRLDFLPKRVRILLDINLAKEAIVQLYYQTNGSNEFSEQSSLKKTLSPGRHSIEWTLEEMLNGAIRLDPGSQPGPYRIHKLQFQQ